MAGAARVGATRGSAQLQLVFPLQTRGLAGLRQFAMAVSTPGNPLYRHYESIPELARRFGASSNALRSTVRYLERAGATGLTIDATGLFVDATMRARTAERLFGTSLTEFRGRQGRFTAPSHAPALPDGLRGLVTGVVGLNTAPIAFSPDNFARNRIARRGLAAQDSHSAAAALTPFAHVAAQQASGYTPATGTQSGCAAAQQTGSFTPNQYLTAYNFAPLQAQGLNGSGERMALIEIDGFKKSDIDTFANCFGLRVPKISAFGVGIGRPLSPGGESTLDLEVLTAAAPGLKEIDVYESSADESSALKALTSPLQNTGFKPEVISASLGLCEPYVQAAVGQKALNSAEGALEEAAASGISFLDSSGDSGSADCTKSDGAPQPELAVNYPTSSWWVTGVGGTNLALNPDNSIANQVVWNDAGLQPGSAGGGGQSVIWKRPSYQNGVDPAALRQVPDVSMLADVAPGYAIYCSAQGACVSPQQPDPWQGIGGTSAGTPLLAGGFAIVDQALRQNGKQDLGLANPLLYQIGQNAAQRPTVFSDVTAIGNDVGPFIDPSGAPLGCCTAGPGYDDASGWGSVNLGGFESVALSTQPAIVNISMTVPQRQSPVRDKKIKTTVTCSGKCLAGAFATFKVGHLKPFKVYSKLVPIASAGSAAAPIKLQGQALKALKLALKAHFKVTATLTGAIVDAGGNIEKRTPTATLQITS
jgi:kumamolisin